MLAATALPMMSQVSVLLVMPTVWCGGGSDVDDSSSRFRGGDGNVDGRCCFWVWVRVRGVFGLLWAPLASLPAGPGDDHRRLALSMFGGRPWRGVISLVGLPHVLLQGLGVGDV